MTTPNDLTDWTLAVSQADSALVSGQAIANGGGTVTLPVAGYQSLWVQISSAPATPPTWLQVDWSEDAANLVQIASDNLSSNSAALYSCQLAVDGPYVTFTNPGAAAMFLTVYGSTHVAVNGRIESAQGTFEGAFVTATTAGVGSTTVLPVTGIYQGDIDIRAVILATGITGSLRYATRGATLIMADSNEFVTVGTSQIARVRRAVPAAQGIWEFVQAAGAGNLGLQLQLAQYTIPF